MVRTNQRHILYSFINGQSFCAKITVVPLKHLKFDIFCRQFILLSDVNYVWCWVAVSFTYVSHLLLFIGCICLYYVTITKRLTTHFIVITVCWLESKFSPPLHLSINGSTIPHCFLYLSGLLFCLRDLSYKEADILKLERTKHQFELV